MKFFLQESRDREHWKNLEEDDNPYDLMVQGRDCDDHGGKYEFRVVGDDNKVFWHYVAPYEGVRINMVSNDNWLRQIQNDYNFDDELFAKACARWLAAYHEKI